MILRAFCRKKKCAGDEGGTPPDAVQGPCFPDACNAGGGSEEGVPRRFPASRHTGCALNSGSPPLSMLFMDRRQDAPRISLFYIYFLIYLIFRPKGPLAPLPASFLSLSFVSLRILRPPLPLPHHIPQFILFPVLSRPGERAEEHIPPSLPSSSLPAQEERKSSACGA